MLSHPFIVVPVEPLVSPVPALKLLIRQTARESHTRNHEMISTEDFCNLVDNISVQPAYRSSDCHNRGDPDNDADERQKCAELMREDRLQGNPQGVRIEREEGFHQCNSKLVMPRATGCTKNYRGKFLGI